MKSSTINTFSLDSFEGPLDLLWHLINKNEIDIYEISLYQIVQQYLEKIQAIAADQNLDDGAEFVSMAASLIWLKSKTLLPKHEQQEDLIHDEEEDPRFEIIHKLIDYCRFKQAAKSLSEREQQQSGFYLRGVDNDTELKKNLGIDHLSIEDLALLFRQILAKSSHQRSTIQEEVWRVSDKIKALRYLLQENSSLSFWNLFSPEKSREELIVTFLALLELMKSGEARVINDATKNTISIISTN